MDNGLLLIENKYFYLNDSINFSLSRNIEFCTLIIKIMGIAYLTEFAVNICIDTNNSSLADKVALAGKVIIICMALPLITSLLDVIIAILPT